MNKVNNTEIIDKLMSCLKKVSELTSDELEKYDVDANYFDENILDSMGFMLFVIEIENEFKIKFKPEDMQSYDFQSIRGIANIIINLN